MMRTRVWRIVLLPMVDCSSQEKPLAPVMRKYLNSPSTVRVSDSYITDAFRWVEGALESAWRAVHGVLMTTKEPQRQKLLETFYKTWGRHDQISPSVPPIPQETTSNANAKTDSSIGGVPYDVKNDVLLQTLMLADANLFKFESIRKPVGISGE